MPTAIQLTDMDCVCRRSRARLFIH